MGQSNVLFDSDSPGLACDEVARGRRARGLASDEVATGTRAGGPAEPDLLCSAPELADIWNISLASPIHENSRERPLRSFDPTLTDGPNIPLASPIHENSRERPRSREALRAVESDGGGEDGAEAARQRGGSRCNAVRCGVVWARLPSAVAFVAWWSARRACPTRHS